MSFDIVLAQCLFVMLLHTVHACTALEHRIVVCMTFLNACICLADAERRKLKLKQSEKDAKAVSMMQRLRVQWSSEEDSLVSTDVYPY